jgi:hypothetical protein
MDPLQQLAQSAAAAEAARFVATLNSVILYPLIALLSGIAFLVFVYGAAEYVFNATNDSARAEGKKHIMYGIIGLFVMVSAFAILRLAAGTFGLNTQLNCADNPSGSGCANIFTP